MHPRLRCNLKPLPAPPLWVLGALLALGVNLAIPAIHALHDAQARATQAEAPHEQHEESDCPTCQQFVSLRSFTSLSLPVMLLDAGSTEARPTTGREAPFVAPFAHAPAVPRGPPVC